MPNGNGGAGDIIKLFTDFLSSAGGGFLVSQMSAAEFDREWKKFGETIDEANRRGWDILTQQIGIGQPAWRVRDEVTNPQTRAVFQAKIDAGEDLEAFGQYVEHRPRFPSAIEVAFALGQEGLARGEEYFDPEGAAQRFQEAFAPIVQGYQGLPGAVMAGGGRVQELYGDLSDMLRARSAGLMDFYGGLRGELRTGAEELAGGYEDILGTARGLVSGLGEAERADINRRWTETGTELEMGLGARGLAGGTISSSIASGIERERGTALLGLEEQVARQQLGVEETFGLPALSAQERLLGAGINLGALQAGTAQQLLGAQLNLGGQQAGAMQFGNQLYANTTMGSLAALGNIAGGQVGAWDAAAVNRLNNLLAFGGFPIQTQMQGAQMALGWTGPRTEIMPTAPTGPIIQPYGDPSQNW